MALSANLKARLPGTSATLVDAVLPGGTRRYSDGWYSSLGTGQYEAKLLSLSTIREGVSDDNGSLQGNEIAFSIADTDRSLAALFTGASAHLVVGSAVTVRVAEIGCAEADWSTRFTGVITDVGFGEPMAATIRASTDDLVLRKTTPEPAWLITPGDWPKAKQDLYGKLYQFPYGKLSMAAYSGTGALECYCVDTAAFKYLVCAGRAKAVKRVYADRTLVATSAYSVVYTTINGRGVTLIVFTASQADAVITADIEGYEATGDGSGALIETQTAILAHFLSNFVFGRYRSGNWLATHSRIDATSLSALATFFGDRNYKGAFSLLEKTTGKEIIQKWLLNNEAKALWLPTGKLGVSVEDPTFTDIYNASLPVARHDAGFKYTCDDTAIVSSIAISYARSPAEGQYFRSLEVSDPGGDPEAIETLEQPFGALE